MKAGSCQAIASPTATSATTRCHRLERAAVGRGLGRARNAAEQEERQREQLGDPEARPADAEPLDDVPSHLISADLADAAAERAQRRRGEPPGPFRCLHAWYVSYYVVCT